MAIPAFEAFTASARKALAEVIEPEASAVILRRFDRMGAQFHFYDDGGLDSLDMLDVCFYIERDLKLKLEFEKMVHNNVSMTVENLYNSIVQRAVSPA